MYIGLYATSTRESQLPHDLSLTYIYLRVLHIT